MWPVIAALFLSLLGYGLIGFAPTLLLLRGSRRVELGLALAPIVGFLLTCLVTVYLASANVPVTCWAPRRFWLAALAGAAAAAWLLLRRERTLLRQTDRRTVVILLGGFVVSFLLVMAPLAVGGLRFAAWRGNPYDAYNYMDMALYLDRVPMRFGAEMSAQQLLEHHPSYPLGRWLLYSRWATSAMLAVTADITRLPVYRVEFGYSALMFVFAFGPALMLAERLPLRRRWALATALVVSTGFWAQFVLDIRAVSQCNSVPTLLALALFATLFGEAERRGFGLLVLLALGFAGLLLLYTEAAPLALGGLALFGARALAWRTIRPLRLVAGLAALAVGLLLALPPFDVFAYLNEQAGVAFDPITSEWHTAYFPWLFDRFFTGLWGFSFFVVDAPSSAPADQPGTPTPFLVLAVVLWLGLAIAVVRFVGHRRLSAAACVCVALAVTAFVEAAILTWRQQMWSAGKALSFAAPFLILSALFPVLADTARRPGWRLLAWCDRFTRLSAAAWLAVQLGAAFYRIGHVAPEDCPQYLAGTPASQTAYRAVDWETSALTRKLDRYRRGTVAVSTGDSWGDDYLSLALQRHRPVKLNWVVNRNRPKVFGRQTLAALPDYVIADVQAVRQHRLGRLVIAGNDSFQLLRAEDAEDMRSFLKQRGWSP